METGSPVKSREGMREEERRDKKRDREYVGLLRLGRIGKKHI